MDTLSRGSAASDPRQPTMERDMSQGAIDMCRRFALQHIGYWRDAKRKGLPKTAAENRAAALWWLAKAKGQ